MALKLVNKKNYTMRPGEFVWGFDPASVHVLSPATLGNRPGSETLHELLAGMLLAKLARAGWDVPDLDVMVDTYDAEARGLFRYVSKVRGEHRGVQFELEFFGKLSTGYDFIPGRFQRFRFGEEKFPDEIRKWTAAQVDLFEDIVMSSISTAAAAAPSPGAGHITREGDANIRRLFHRDPVPTPPDFPVLYCWVPTDQLHRRPEGVILTSTGLILVSDCGPDDIPLLPERRYDSFDYASPDIRVKADQGTFWISEKSVPVEVKLRDLNEIYVMDMAAQDDARARVHAAIVASGRRESSREEIYEVQTAAAKTMVPASEYTGGFRRPVYAIGRHLLYDEARFMKGQVKVVYDQGVLATTMVDDRSGGKVVFQSCDSPGPGRFHDMIRDAEAVSYHIGCELEVEDSVLEEMEMRRAKSEARRATELRGP
jgi:hypothetical protein|nr:hypothetical protein [Neorhizobium tomejilense]